MKDFAAGLGAAGAELGGLHYFWLLKLVHSVYCQCGLTAQGESDEQQDREEGR